MPLDLLENKRETNTDQFFVVSKKKNVKGFFFAIERVGRSDKKNKKRQ